MKKNDIDIVSSICYELLYSGWLAEKIGPNPSIIINPGNDGWFKSQVIPFVHFSASVFRSIEYRRAILRSFNSGLSGLISAGGITKNIIPINEQGFRVFAVPAYEEKTIYLRFGEIFIFLIAFVLFVFEVSFFYLRRNNG